MASSFRPPASRGFSAPAYHSSHISSQVNAASSSSSSSSSSTSSSSYSYFSPSTPLTGVSPAISPATPYSSGVSPNTTVSTSDYPIITTTVTSPNSGNSATNTTTHSSLMSGQEDALRQFALHIPSPPTLTLGPNSRRPQAHAIHAPQRMPSSSGASGMAGAGYPNLPSPLDRTRRMPASDESAPRMTVTSTVYGYQFSVKLSSAIQREMVTISANKGDKLKVVADAWHMENESHYEWQITFPPRDIDMNSVHAKFDENEKTLTIDVRRVPRLYR